MSDRFTADASSLFRVSTAITAASDTLAFANARLANQEGYANNGFGQSASARDTATDYENLHRTNSDCFARLAQLTAYHGQQLSTMALVVRQTSHDATHAARPGAPAWT